MAEEPGHDQLPAEPPRGLASRGPMRPPSRYSLMVGLVFIGLIIYAVANAILSEGGGTLGTDPGETGSALAEFAVPEAIGGPAGDANVYQDDCATSTSPCPEEDSRTPACQVDLERVIRVCDYFDRPLVISFWFTRFANCLPAQDEIDAIAGRYGGRVNFISINVRDDLEKVRSIIEERGWQIPVGYDADGEVSNLYHVGGCPTVLLAYPGGILHTALIGDAAGGANLEREIEMLLRESRRRAAADA